MEPTALVMVGCATLHPPYGMPYGNSLATVASGDQAKGPVVVAFLQASKEPKSLARKDPRIEHDQRGISHQGMQVIEQVMASEQGPDVADSRYENQIVSFGRASWMKK